MQTEDFFRHKKRQIRAQLTLWVCLSVYLSEHIYISLSCNIKITKQKIIVTHFIMIKVLTCQENIVIQNICRNARRDGQIYI